MMFLHESKSLQMTSNFIPKPPVACRSRRSPSTGAAQERVAVIPPGGGHRLQLGKEVHTRLAVIPVVECGFLRAAVRTSQDICHSACANTEYIVYGNLYGIYILDYDCQVE